MIAFFKNKARARAIRAVRQKLKRNMRFNNLNSVKTAGIIVCYQLDIQNEGINKLLDIFKQKGIRSEVLVYYPEKKLPANVNTDNNNMLLFAQGNTNWFGIPKSMQVNDFISKEFDLLIDLCTEHVYTLQYIVEASRASFKVGRLSYKDNPYDFTLVDDNSSDSKYIDNLFKYMSKLG